ncbi:MAG: hypothetical protein HDT44_01580 [Ruminococcaceae bacterium]|nr:hypothetical protein [Oscillospiraceae bacterium]
MKIFKKILAGVVSAAVIASALAVPTAALTTTPKTESKSGQIVAGKKTIRYGGDLTATTTYARASASSSMNTNLSVKVTAYAKKSGTSVNPNIAQDVILDKSVTVSVDNMFMDGTSKKPYDITMAIGDYGIGKEIFSLTVV